MNTKKILVFACSVLVIVLILGLYLAIDIANGGLSYSPYDDAPYIPDGVRYGKDFEEFDETMGIANLHRIEKEVNRYEEFGFKKIQYRIHVRNWFGVIPQFRYVEVRVDTEDGTITDYNPEVTK